MATLRGTIYCTLLKGDNNIIEFFKDPKARDLFIDQSGPDAYECLDITSETVRDAKDVTYVKDLFGI